MFALKNKTQVEEESNNLKNLTQIPVGQEFEIVNINGGHHFQQKTNSMGLRIGVKVIKLSAQMMNGPVTIKIGRSRLAIGHGMAKKIWVKIN